MLGTAVNAVSLQDWGERNSLENNVFRVESINNCLSESVWEVRSNVHLTYDYEFDWFVSETQKYKK